MNLSDSRSPSRFNLFSRARVSPNLVFAVIILTALLAFEIFNYSTTDYALTDLLGELRFAGIRWATILAVAFCGIDFAGIARLFTPEQGSEEPKEIWYLFGAWLLAATMNAILTWWGVSMAVMTHTVNSTTIMNAGTLTKIVPIFVAIMVWVIRILIIGSLSLAGDRFLWHKAAPRRSVAAPVQRNTYSGAGRGVSTPVGVQAAPASRPSMSRSSEPANSNPRPEPTYHSLSMSARPSPRPSTPAARPSANRPTSGAGSVTPRRRI